MMSESSDPHLEGLWLPIRAELDGVEAPAMVIERIELTLRAGAYAVHFAGEHHDRGRYELITVESGHARLTLTSKHGENAGRIFPSIYQLVGSRLRICYGLDGIVPDTFSTSIDSRRYLVTYRRKD